NVFAGVVSMMTRLTNLLHREDSQVYYHIYQNQAIKPHYYAFRWITLLLSQEFPLPEVLRIWDFLFADDNRFSFLIDVCCSMLMLLHDDLLNGDFASNMKLLQNFPDKIDVSTIIRRAKKIRSTS
ncbi:TBC1 domain family member 13-like protein, partial [Leptotrombidium deliense]